MSHEHSSDSKAAFTGLIVTALALFVFAFGIVMYTNAKYAGHEAGKAAESQAH